MKDKMAVNQEESSFPGIQFGNRFVREDFPNEILYEFDNSWNLNFETRISHNYVDGTTEKVSEDVVDLLPRDPFGMDISATVTAITEWIEDFGLKNMGFEAGEDKDENVDNQLLAKPNIVWNCATGIHAGVDNMKSETMINESSMEFNNGVYDGRLLLDGDNEDIMGLNFDKYWTPPATTNKHQGCKKNNTDGIPGPPPDALFFGSWFSGCEGVSIC